MTASPHLDALVDAMTLEERVSLLSGADFWSVPGVERLGVGPLVVTDGPNGARGGGSLVGGLRAACFPCGIALGATWDPGLVEEVGAALAQEARSKGAHVLLGPTINIQRSVTNGRNFECFSEDPHLTARLAVAYVQGLQGAGVAATPKHFAGNESEVERTTVNSVIDERALREVYLAPFEAAATEGGAWALMTAYNKLNGTYAAESGRLLTAVLREEWGWDGLVMSDWFGSRSLRPTVEAGLDLEMPGPPRDRGAALVAAVEAGEIDAGLVRASALRVLRLMERTGALHEAAARPEREEDRPEHRALIRRAGAAGMVLLRNEGGLLPLDHDGGQLGGQGGGAIAVIGPNARAARIMGGGSAQLNPHHAASPWDGLAARLGEDRLRFAQGCTNHRWEPLWTGELRAEFFAGRDLAGAPVHEERMADAQAFWIPPVGGGRVDPRAFSARVSGTFTPEASGVHRFGVFATGPVRMLVDGRVVAEAWEGWTRGRTFFEEGCDEVVGEAVLEAGQACAVAVEFAAKPGVNLGFSALRAGIGRPLGDDAIADAARVAAQADVAVVCVGRSGEWDTEGSDLQDIRLPGRQDELVRAVLAANPRTVVLLQTGGPVEMPWAGDVPAILQAWYPGQEAGHAVTDVLLGDAEPGGRLPQTFPLRWEDNPTWSDDPEVYPGRGGRVRYAEGPFIGHRHYDRLGLAPLFPFGHGLGFTTWEVAALAVEPDAEGATATCRVTNAGGRRGSAVVQVYLGPEAPEADRPARELKGFAKATLDPGASEVVRVPLPPRAFSVWDEGAQAWRVAPGRYRVEAGLSVGDIRATATWEAAAGAVPPA